MRRARILESDFEAGGVTAGGENDEAGLEHAPTLDEFADQAVSPVTGSNAISRLMKLRGAPGFSSK